MNEVKKCVVLSIFLSVFAFLYVFTVFWCLGGSFVFLLLLLYTSRDYSEDTKQTFSSRLKYVILFAICIKVFAVGWNSSIIFMLLKSLG